MNSQAYFNGEFMPLDQVRISPLDRGFLFGDSVYEIIPCYRQRLFRPHQHIQRLLRSLDAIYLPSPHSAEEWQSILQQLAALNPLENQTLYLQVTRGVEPQRDHVIKTDASATVFIMSSAMDQPSLACLDQETGIVAVTQRDQRWQHCDIKCTSLMANILLRHQATLQQARETILIRDGLVTEGTSSNVFAVMDNTLVTPPLSQFLLGGITRDLLLELAANQAMAATQEAISQAQLREAQEVWITSSSVGIRPVVQLDNTPVADGKPGPRWRQLAQSFIQYRQSLMG